MLYSSIIFIDKVNQDTSIYYAKGYATACDFISQIKRDIPCDWVEGEDYVIFNGSEIEFSDVFIEEECESVQPGIYRFKI